MESGKDIRIGVEDLNKLDEIYSKLHNIIFTSGITYYTALGILECVKNDILRAMDEEDSTD